MESALTTSPLSFSASASAKADLPLAVGPAMRMTVDTSQTAPFPIVRIARHVLCGNADLVTGPSSGDRRLGAEGCALSAAWPSGGLARARRGDRYRLSGRGIRGGRNPRSGGRRNRGALQG